MLSEQSGNPTLISFLIGAITAMAGFTVWLVKVILGLLKDVMVAMTEMKSVVANNTQTLKDTSEQTRLALTEVLTEIRR